MRSLLSEDLRAYITNSEGAVDEVIRAAGYLRRVEAMDLASAQFTLGLTQVVTVRPDLVRRCPRKATSFWSS